jgi:hypothetical protein
MINKQSKLHIGRLRHGKLRNSLELGLVVTVLCICATLGLPGLEMRARSGVSGVSVRALVRLSARHQTKQKHQLKVIIIISITITITITRKLLDNTRTLLQQLPHTLHPLLRPALLESFSPLLAMLLLIKNLHRNPSSEIRFQYRSHHILHR